VEINKCYNENCLDTMKRMDNNFIDLTVTSPPYDNLRNYNGYSFDFESIAKELFRVTKQGGVIVWVVNDSTIKSSESGTSFRQALYFKEIGFNLHDTMIYIKNNPTPIKANRYQPCFEYMFVLSKGVVNSFNPIKRNRIYDDFRRKTSFGRNKEGEHQQGTNSSDKEITNYNVWCYNVGGGNTSKDKIAFEHPAIFPEQLANDHIVSWSNEGDLVYDPFMGSGTTAKMAIINKRNWIGSEISSEYCDIIQRRING